MLCCCLIISPFFWSLKSAEYIAWSLSLSCVQLCVCWMNGRALWSTYCDILQGRPLIIHTGHGGKGEGEWEWEEEREIAREMNFIIRSSSLVLGNCMFQLLFMKTIYILQTYLLQDSDSFDGWWVKTKIPRIWKPIFFSIFSLQAEPKLSSLS